MTDATIVSYTDPLMDLLHEADLNKQAELSERLLAYIEDIPDSKIRQWCIDSLTVLRDLERIELKLHGWEFTTLDYRLNIEQNETDDIKLNLSKRVLNISLDLYDQLNIQSNQILISIDRSQLLSPIQLISDAGTILTELVLRLTKLREQLHKDISIGYSRAKLVIIGCELQNMVITAQSRSRSQSHSQSQLDPIMINNYKEFVNTLLSQLEQSVTSGDTMSTMECIAIVNDVEKMFETMKSGQSDSADDDDDDSSRPTKPNTKSKTPSKSKSKSKSKPMSTPHSNSSSTPKSKSSNSFSSTCEDYDYDSEGTLVSPSTSVTSIKKLHRRTTSSLRADTELTRTTISEQLPSLLSAFKEPSNSIKEEEEEDDDEEDQDSEDEDEQRNNDSHIDDDNDNDNNNDNDTNNETESQSQEIPLPSIMNSLFGSSLLRPFYQPQMKEPIYIPQSQDTVLKHDSDKLIGSTSTSTSTSTLELTPKEEEESKNVINTMYKASKIQENALVHERHMKQLQQIEQMRLPQKKQRTDYLVSPQFKTLKDVKVETETQPHSQGILGALSWPSSVNR